MRQSDGSEILGPDDPRNLVIGIIHVTPGDERQNVLTAISTQEKLGRDQIILDLPAQNKAFKAAVDFEGLRQMSSEIEAGLVLVVPPKSKIANFARREGFTLYHSLDELVEAEFPALESDEADTNASEIDVDEADHTMIFPVTPSASATIPTADLPEPLHTDLPASATTPTANLPGVPQTDLPASATTPTANLPEVSQAPEAEEEANTMILPPAGDATAAPPPPPPAPEITEPQPVNSSVTHTDPELAAVNPSQIPATSADDPQQRASYLPVPQPGNALIPSSSLPPALYEPVEPPRRSWRGLFIAAIIVLVLIGLGLLFNRPILDLIFPPSATITITPDSQQLKQTYQMTAVLGLPDPSKDQVDARALYATSQTQEQTVDATGQGHTPGQQAQGELIFYNSATVQQTIPEGTVIFDNNGVALVNEHRLVLPPFDPAQSAAGTPDSAHTINIGANQNIPAYDLHNTACCALGIYVTNISAFTGGEDAHDFKYVQQSDIDGVTQSLEATLSQQAITALQSQVRANEKPASTPVCAPQQASNHQAGERADTVTVSVKTTCMGEVYDMQAVQTLAEQKLTRDARTNPGQAYAPVGQILATVTKSTPDNHGNVLLLVDATGVWVYHFTSIQLQHLAGLIAGKNSDEARTLLLQNKPGVSKVSIALTGAGATTMPGDTKRITINIAAVEGLHT